MKSNLKEKVAVITGGGGILCRIIARGLAKEGVKIAILDISLDKARNRHRRNIERRRRCSSNKM